MAYKAETSLLNQCCSQALAFSPLTVTLCWSLVTCLACGLAWATSAHLRVGLLTLNLVGKWLGLLVPPPDLLQKACDFLI